MRARDGLSFYVHHRDLIGRHIAKYGRHEPIPTGWLNDYLATAKPGLFVDVGANLGWHAVHAAQHRAVETVVAFEPDPFNAWLLDRNLALTASTRPSSAARRWARNRGPRGCIATSRRTTAATRCLPITAMTRAACR